MTVFNPAAFFDAARPLFGGKLSQAQVDGLNAALQAYVGASGVAYPAWTSFGMTKLGEREIAGPKHNPFITEEMWRDLGASWLKTDDNDGPWCGGFAAWCVNKVGLPYPKDYPKAAAWAPWGVPCKPQVGAFIVKSRDGGNHVAQIVGITRDGLYYLALGGNQSDSVSIAPFPVSAAYACRWPAGVPELHIPMPIMEKKTSIGSEA